MKGMDEVDVAQAEIADVPSAFDQSVVLLDVREDDEWQRGHAPGAQHIPMGEMPARIGEIDPGREAVRGLSARRAVTAGGRSIWPATVMRRSTSAAACRRGQTRGGR